MFRNPLSGASASPRRQNLRTSRKPTPFTHALSLASAARHLLRSGRPLDRTRFRSICPSVCWGLLPPPSCLSLSSSVCTPRILCARRRASFASRKALPGLSFRERQAGPVIGPPWPWEARGRDSFFLKLEFPPFRPLSKAWPLLRPMTAGKNLHRGY